MQMAKFIRNLEIATTIYLSQGDSEAYQPMPRPNESFRQRPLVPDNPATYKGYRNWKPAHLRDLTIQYICTSAAVF